MRLIDADELERAISVSHSMIDDCGIKTGYEISMKLVEDAPTIETPHWIPCTERLPKNRQEVIVYVNDGAVYIDIDQYNWDEFLEHEKNVIAWMPLPEPYKGDTE